MTTTTSCAEPAATTEATTSRPATRERGVFLAATAAVMLHIADDNFFQPEPGVSAGDHLVSGLVPLGLLAVAALSFLRVRAGARGP